MPASTFLRVTFSGPALTNAVSAKTSHDSRCKAKRVAGRSGFKRVHVLPAASPSSAIGRHLARVLYASLLRNTKFAVLAIRPCARKSRQLKLMQNIHAERSNNTETARVSACRPKQRDSVGRLTDNWRSRDTTAWQCSRCIQRGPVMRSVVTCIRRDRSLVLQFALVPASRIREGSTPCWLSSAARSSRGTCR